MCFRAEPWLCQDRAGEQNTAVQSSKWFICWRECVTSMIEYENNRGSLFFIKNSKQLSDFDLELVNPSMHFVGSAFSFLTSSLKLGPLESLFFPPRKWIDFYFLVTRRVCTRLNCSNFYIAWMLCATRGSHGRMLSEGSKRPFLYRLWHSPPQKVPRRIKEVWTKPRVYNWGGIHAR